MTDDWSLEFLKIKINDQEVYYANHIETLRQKILDDIKWERLSLRQLTDDSKNKKDFYDTSPYEKEEGRMKALDEVVKIINKRFGVEE